VFVDQRHNHAKIAVTESIGHKQSRQCEQTSEWVSRQISKATRTQRSASVNVEKEKNIADMDVICGIMANSDVGNACC
jgi:hypothetical protein